MKEKKEKPCKTFVSNYLFSIEDYLSIEKIIFLQTFSL